MLPNIQCLLVVPRGLIIGLMILEAFILVVDTLGFFVIASVVLFDDGRPKPVTLLDWLNELTVPLGFIGLLALWMGFIGGLVLRRQFRRVTGNMLHGALLLGAIAVVAMFVGSASTGRGLAGFGFFEVLVLALLYGGPIAIGFHIVLARKAP